VAPRPAGLGLVLAYGYFPAGAIDVELLMADGSTQPRGTTTDDDRVVWAVPFRPDEPPVAVRYVDADGRAIRTVAVPD
jgi:hypothetical protein